ncbi:MAG: HAMP domain-containing protein [candidate division Zixibacteria bacterium]|nr:HAMP domain-containing protein [candidate division Zixibacteria bacterium]
MNTSFRRRIFLLLLLFAAVPAILLTLVGYYIAVDTPLSTAEEGHAGLADLTTYYNDRLCAGIQAAVGDYRTTGRVDSSRIDFVYRIPIDGPAYPVYSPELDSASAAYLIGLSTQKDRGVITVDKRYFQFVRVPDSTADILAGLVHTESYNAIAEGVQRDMASRAALRELRTSYIAFVGGLFFFITALTIIAAYIASARVSTTLARPLSSLSESAARIAEGDFRQHVQPSGADEIRKLIASFNDMALQLDQMTDRLTQTERVAAWRQVARRFAHELKNPLQPILVSLYRIEKQLADSPAYEQIKDPLRAASEEVRHLTLLADRFSSLAKLPPPTITAVDLKSLLSSVVLLYREKTPGISIALDIPETNVNVKTDDSRIREALHNLLQNAIDAIGTEGIIECGITTRENELDIYVRDNGPGMDAATLASARLPYFTTKESGTGLGLAIVEKSIAELGGRLRADSTQGQGTTMILTLPWRQE